MAVTAERSGPAVVESPRAGRALILVSAGVLLASSTWFSGTAAIPTLKRLWSLSDADGAWLTIAVQLGFIVGTLMYASLNIADLFNARRVFCASAVLGALLNGAFALGAQGWWSVLIPRFLTGVTLAGIYPVGMKIVATWFRSGLGWRLGVMVGALTLGTASPYLIQAVGGGLPWRLLAASGSVAAVVGGLLVLVALEDGPHSRPAPPFEPGMAVRIFRHAPFRYAAIGYFGHMWELYAFWSQLVPFLGASLEGRGVRSPAWLSGAAFLTVGMGSLGCVLGGWASRKIGEREVALISLVVSGTLCALSPWTSRAPLPVLGIVLAVWGFFVVSDSPQFSALAARHCPPEYVGTALTIQNGVGFAVTIISIRLVPLWARVFGWRWAFAALALGPLVGAASLQRLSSRPDSKPEG